MNQTPKKRTSSSYSVTKVVALKDNEDQKSDEMKRKFWTPDELAKQLKPTSEEIKYRKKKLEADDALAKYSKYFKCTKCDLNFKSLTQNVDDIAVHSCLQVLFCKQCLDFYEDGEFSVDSEGEEKYCRWCGEGGLIYSCSKCLSGFCTLCIKKHFGVKYNGQVNKNKDWECFLCCPKPLWYLRFLCSLAVTELKRLKENPSLDSNQAKVTFDKEKEKDEYTQVSSSWDANAEIKSQDSGSAASSVASDALPASSDITVTQTPSSEKGIKRKRIVYSSSDESVQNVRTRNKKKIKLKQSPKSKSNKQSSSRNFISPEVFEKLEKILRLAEYQMAFGVSWSSKMLTKLYKPNFVNSSEELKTECQKIKWFFSILSTYLVESCSSVDLIEKSIANNEQKFIPSPDKTHQGDYSTVVKFLDFITNQVKVFLENGINLQDLLEGEIYQDSQIIGIKVKSKASPSTSGHQALTPKNKIKNSENKGIDVKNSGEKTSDDESIVPSLEIDGGRDSSETDDGSSKKTLNCSDQYPQYLEDAEDQKMKIQEILSILENA